MPVGGWGSGWVTGAPSATLGPLSSVLGCLSPEGAPALAALRQLPGLEKAVLEAVSHLSSGSSCSLPQPLLYIPQGLDIHKQAAFFFAYWPHSADLLVS